jgi:hypothetical protein
MSRAMRLMTALCAASLLGNAWLYRELKVRERAEPRRAAALAPQTQSPVAEAGRIATPAAVVVANPTKPNTKQAADKCRKKFEDEFRRQLRDPQEREKLKRQEILTLQAFNMGAATRLHLNEQTYGRILELQAEQNLSEREASIGSVNLAKGVAVNPQIAEEFGEAVAAKWVENQRESTGRIAVRGVANLFADANVPLSDEQRNRLVSVYADAFEMQSVQDSAPDMHETQENLRKPGAMQAWWGKLLARQVAFDQRVQVDAASFLTPAQMELLRNKADVDSERFHSMMETMPKTADDSADAPEPTVEC